MSLRHEFAKGIAAENPLFRIGLGLCPALAVSTTLKGGVGMGVATTLVLIASNVIQALVGPTLPRRASMLGVLAVAAGLATGVDLAMTAYLPGLRASLGIFVPLIAVSCVVLGRAEAAVRGGNAAIAALDGLGTGVGFTLALSIVAGAREMIGSGRIWDVALSSQGSAPILGVALAPGAFLTLGFVAGLWNRLLGRR